MQMSKLLVLVAYGVDAMRPTGRSAPKCSRRQSFVAASTLLLLPTAAVAATDGQFEEAAKQGILKCFEKQGDKSGDVCKLAEIEARKAREAAPPRQVTAETPVDMDALRVAREKSAEKKAGIKLRETPEWLSGSKSGEAGDAARERLPGAIGGGKKAAPKEKSKPELSAAAAEAVREAAASGLPEGWVEVTDEGTGRVFYGNVKTGERQLERPQ